jgi:hypothetical protein
MLLSWRAIPLTPDYGLHLYLAPDVPVGNIGLSYAIQFKKCVFALSLSKQQLNNKADYLVPVTSGE